ncbi:MAG TPA: HHIP-like protein 1 [Runella sp.]|nr:HHIP-like protein 1 [Runella sp.]
MKQLSYLSRLSAVGLIAGAVVITAQAQQPTPPDENRFTKSVLTEKLDEPMEITFLPDKRILFVERKGNLKAYDPKTKEVSVLATIPVNTKYTNRQGQVREAEEGLMGLIADPNYAKNNWIYMYYADPSEKKHVLARWELKGSELVEASKKIVLEVPTQREECCHTGGGMVFDKAGNLYLTTGNNTSNSNSDGYAPIDERPNQSTWDDQRGAASTNDLRGKILRIKPQADGKYTIPEGNLFPKGTPQARPEIYTMGHRNPWRPTLDSKTGFLYWGEVGPDASKDSERGPRGYDELNQAKEPGFFGWPYFIGDNKVYGDWDFESNKLKADSKFDPAKPINDSPNNTGLRELPPAQKAFIYYPYADSPEFGDIVGKGGRNAMGGPVYYYDDYPETSVKFPRHYDGKFFAYDWIRDWIHPVTMKPNGDFVKMETFMPSTKFSHIIDMQFANDGSLYTIEYGQKWFGANADARLARITYNAGNRKPVAIASANKKVGAAPLTDKFDGGKSLDYDGDALKYEWSFGKNMPKQTTASPTVTFSKPGVYPATLKVTDAMGNVSTQTMDIKVGNDEPKVEVEVAGNKTFYFPNKPVKYAVKVIDKEDGTLQKGISPDDVTMTIDYLEGFDKTLLAQGHQANTGSSTGKRLIELSDCKACHTIDQKSIGPAYMDVAKKYKGTGSESKLIRKIITGGGGVWGEQAMSAHPQLKESEVADMVGYILSLADEKAANRKPIAGDYVPVAQKKDGSYILTATYTDRGNGVIGPLTGSTSVALRSPSVKAVTADAKRDIFQFDMPKVGPAAVGTKSGSYVAFKDIDMTGIESISPTVFASTTQTVGGKLEARINSPTGPLLGEVEVKPGTAGPVNLPVRQPVQGMHTLYLVFVNPEAGQKALFALDKVQFGTQGM